MLGMKGSTFPAKKALDQGRRLGGDEGRRRRSQLLAQADVDLRGAQGPGPTSSCSRCWWPAWRTSARR